MEQNLKLFRLSDIFPPATHIKSDLSTPCLSHGLNHSVDFFPTSTLLLGDVPSRFIPYVKPSKPSRDLRLVIHDSAGGEVHHLLKYLVREVEHRRGTHVDLEVLTQENPKASKSSSILLLPLFLLPEKHVQNDIPKIFRRLSNQVINTQLVPFLGSWSYWILTLKCFVNSKLLNENSILLHHPINSGEYGDSYLENLKKLLKIPLISWTQWREFSDNSDSTYTPFPLALAPNKTPRD